MHVVERLRSMTPETLGRIVCAGLQHGGKYGGASGPRTSMYEVHKTDYLNPKADGRQLLTKMAATVIVAEIADIILERRRALEAMVDDLAGDAGFVP